MAASGFPPPRAMAYPLSLHRPHQRAADPGTTEMAGVNEALIQDLKERELADSFCRWQKPVSS